AGGYSRAPGGRGPRQIACRDRRRPPLEPHPGCQHPGAALVALAAHQEPESNHRPGLRAPVPGLCGASRSVRVIRTHTVNTFACAAADFIADRLRQKPRSVLALPTGKTPLGLYAELVRRSLEGAVNLTRARIFNLDEY